MTLLEECSVMKIKLVSNKHIIKAYTQVKTKTKWQDEETLSIKELHVRDMLHVKKSSKVSSVDSQLSSQDVSELLDNWKDIISYFLLYFCTNIKL